QGLRRLDLRRSCRPPAQHPQLLDLRSGARRGARRCAGSPPDGEGRRGLRVRDARHRPWHPSPALSRRLSAIESRLRAARVYFFLKNAQVSSSPRALASSGPFTCVVPPLPTRFALTIRGEVPRCVTTMLRSLPCRPRPPIADCIRLSENFRFQCSYGEPASA